MSTDATTNLQELPSQYDHEGAQQRWYKFWEERGYFHAEVGATNAAGEKKPPFTIVIPPPNVTGALHLGHALNNTLQDILCRQKRMQGYNVLWMPGTDHAGIATQAVVERRLLEEEKKSRHDLGREGLVERIWDWKAQYEKRILGQLKQLGASCDWQRLRFTLDEVCARAVRETFFKLFSDGKIYRGKRLVNWDTYLQTAVSDDEVFHEVTKGHFWHFSYPFVAEDVKPGEPEFVTIATTRPETMLGDTAVAVHPDDPRYKHLHGKKLQHPFLDRQIPVITDAILVDMEFGTGAVKVTPAHDFNDFATGKRHQLVEINILELDGRLNAEAGEFKGMTVPEARKAVKAALAEKGLERGSKPHTLQLPHCQRCHTVVEPMISTQWFVKMEPLAKPALEAVKDGRTQIIPEEWVKTYDHWLGNIQDWCISR
ncbi:MAG: class I tRNA ligase family protein, partial [Planctomycetales bacterium]|nr:class I tRNA ligase family protein [Planctomycetales bacterium]